MWRNIRTPIIKYFSDTNLLKIRPNASWEITSITLAVRLSWLENACHTHFFRRAIFTGKVSQTDVVLGCHQGSSLDLCMQDYKSLCAAVTMCATLVNIQTAFLRGAQPAEIKLTYSILHIFNVKSCSRNTSFHHIYRLANSSASHTHTVDTLNVSECRV